MILKEVRSDQTFFCKFSHATSCQFIFVSTLTLLAISFDRYLYISSPLRYPLIVTWRRTYGILFSIWICASLLPPILAEYEKPTKVRTLCSAPISLAFIAAMIYVVIPLSLIFYYNYKIFRLARGHVRRMHKDRVAFNHVNPTASSSRVALENRFSYKITREMKAIKTFAIVVGVFLLCLVPFMSVILIGSLVCDCVPAIVTVLLGDLAGANSIMNPIIYSMRQKEYKNCYHQIFSAIRIRLMSVFVGT
ncbi:probable G-protein coupled receptor No9 [Dendronephthya gigantea]|uniref:probable G-protein coupled receptor No9 n=1 Tax=Dendronephthya gigantea TaxID=151771 RepID=UPI00106B7A0F|nr:probable G-protein coupled receptor No9 [Dendronephthya gigantea]